MRRPKAETRGRPSTDPDTSEYRGRVGAAIRRVRKEKGMTLQDLEALSGLGVSTISDYENGNADQSIVRLRALAKALDVPICDILPYEPKTNPRGKEANG